MKKSQPLHRSQLKGTPENNNLNHTLKVSKKQLSPLEQYELLRRGFIQDNPNATDIEIIKACIEFANNCGLTLSKKLLEINLQKVEG